MTSKRSAHESLGHGLGRVVFLSLVGLTRGLGIGLLLAGSSCFWVSSPSPGEVGPLPCVSQTLPADWPECVLRAVIKGQEGQAPRVRASQASVLSCLDIPPT